MMENPGISAKDRAFLLEAIKLAEEAGHGGNLPIGAVIVLDDVIVSRGMNTIRQPARDLLRHAEMEALHNLPLHLRSRCGEMTLFSTLEPCMMCTGAILVHQLGRLVYGSIDPFGGVSSCLSSLPPFFLDQLSRMQWIGPALPGECDPLYQRIKEIEGI